MAHWFGIRPWELDELSYGEIEVLTDRLRKLPPVGGVVMVEPRR